MFLFFSVTDFFYGNNFTIKGRQKATFWKSELGALTRVVEIKPRCEEDEMGYFHNGCIFLPAD